MRYPSLWPATFDYAGAGMGTDVKFVLPYLKDPDPAVHLEVALVMSHWRFAVTEASFGKSEIEDILRQVTTGPVALEAATNLAVMAAYWQGKPQPVPTEALASEDSDIAFAAALARYTVEPLLAALRMPRCQFVAAFVLTKASVDIDAELAARLPAFKELEVDYILREVANQGRLCGPTSRPNWPLRRPSATITRTCCATC